MAQGFRSSSYSLHCTPSHLNAPSPAQCVQLQYGHEILSEDNDSQLGPLYHNCRMGQESCAVRKGLQCINDVQLWLQFGYLKRVWNVLALYPDNLAILQQFISDLEFLTFILYRWG